MELPVLGGVWRFVVGVDRVSVVNVLRHLTVNCNPVRGLKEIFEVERRC